MSESKYQAWQAEQRRIRAKEAPGPDPGMTRLGDAIAEFFVELDQRGGSPRTPIDYRQSAWSLLEFLGINAPLRELGDDVGRRWLRWLRATPPRQAKPWSMPKTFSPQNVSRFLADRAAGRGTAAVRRCAKRKEATIGRFWRHGAPILRFLGLPTDLDPQERPRTKRGYSVVCTPAEIAAWWQRYLEAGNAPVPRPGGKAIKPATAGQRRRVVLLQGFLLLTGLRIGEALRADLDDLEGSWLLVGRTKTNTPRIIYCSAQALGVAAALRGQKTFGFTGGRLLGWRHTSSTWNHLVERCGPAPVSKPQQEMRKRLATWLRSKNPDAERAQLGHGGGADVVFNNYLPTLELLPALLEQWQLPEVSGCAWPAPLAAETERPLRLLRELYELVDYRQ
jgi:integrase